MENEIREAVKTLKEYCGNNEECDERCIFYRPSDDGCDLNAVPMAWDISKNN
jgi:hypothetical protein